MGNYKGFDHSYYKAIKNGCPPAQAVEYVAKKYVAHLYESYRIQPSTAEQQELTYLLLEEYDLEREQKKSEKCAWASATRYARDVLDEWEEDDCAHSPQQGAFDHFEAMFDSLPQHSRGSLYDEDMRRAQERQNARSYVNDRSQQCRCSGCTFPSGGYYPRPPGPGRYPPPSSPQYPGTYSCHDPHCYSYTTQEFRPSGSWNPHTYPPPPPPRYQTEEFRPSGSDWNARRSPQPEPSHASFDSQYARRCSTSHPEPSSARDRHQRRPRRSSRSHNREPRARTSRPRPPPPSDDDGRPKTCLYTVLDISRSSSADDIKKSYRKLSMRYHPDRARDADKARATDKMAELNLANDVLSDSKKRAFYDRTGCIPSSTDL